VHRHAVQGNLNVLAPEARRTAELDAVPVDEASSVAERLPHGGVVRQGEGPAVHVELRVLARRPCVVQGQRDQVVPVSLKDPGQSIQKNSTFGKRHSL